MSPPRRQPPNTDDMWWQRHLAEWAEVEKLAGWKDEGAAVVDLAARRLKLAADDEHVAKPKPRPRKQTSRSAAAKKSRMPSTFAKVVREPASQAPVRARSGLFTIDLAKRKVLTASGAEVPGGFAMYLKAERQRATRRRAVVASTLPSNGSRSEAPTTVVTTITTTVSPST